MWAFRIEYHIRTVKHAYFITLTYMDGTLDRTPNGYLTLTKKHFTNFIKRIRKKLGDNKDTPFNDRVKYIVTGEYGTKRQRPHFHAILLNVPYEEIQRHWSYGIADIKEVNTNRIAYCFKYIQKPKRRKLVHTRDDRLPEYVDFSQGIGKQWLTDQKISYHRRNIDNPTITLATGQRIAIPRYFKERIFSDEERKYIAEKMEELSRFSDTDQLSQAQSEKVLLYKNEKIRLMHKKAKKEQL